MLDPDSRIREEGWRSLRTAGIEVRGFVEHLREQLTELNAPFIQRFHVAEGLRGSITFDWTQNVGQVLPQHGGVSFVTKWSIADGGKVHADGARNPRYVEDCHRLQ